MAAERDAALAEVERLRAVVERTESDLYLLALTIHDYLAGEDDIDTVRAAYDSLSDDVRQIVESINEEAGE